MLGHYRFSAYRTPAKRPLRRIEIVEFDAAAARLMKPAVTLGRRWAEAVCLARDLANTPGQDLTPDRLAERAREIARAAGARATIFGGAQLERLGMGAVIAVGRGSVNPPRFVVLERDPARGAKNAPTLVVIGKGVTFDTGGISLKPRENMTKMKYDMSGAAAVLGLFSALATIETPYRVVGLIPTAENMPGGRALKPGDIVRAMDGTTIEVTNTDAEGRLLLADALCYARRFAPEAVVDLATLTGAISIALGNLAGGLFTQDDRLAAELLAAGDATGSGSGACRCGTITTPRCGRDRRPRELRGARRRGDPGRGVPQALRARSRLGPPRHREHRLVAGRSTARVARTHRLRRAAPARVDQPPVFFGFGFGFELDGLFVSGGVRSTRRPYSGCESLSICPWFEIQTKNSASPSLMLSLRVVTERVPHLSVSDPRWVAVASIMLSLAPSVNIHSGRLSNVLS